MDIPFITLTSPDGKSTQLLFPALPVINENSLQYLSDYFQENDNQHSSSSQIAPLIPLCEVILDELIKGGEMTDIQIPLPLSPVRICQLTDSVQISIGSGFHLLLADTSLKKVQLNMINNLIIKNRDDAFSSMTINRYLGHILTNLENDQQEFARCRKFYRKVVSYIIHDTKRLIDNQTRLAAVKHIFTDAAHYSLEFAAQAAEIGIRLSEHYKTNLTDAVRDLIQSCTTTCCRESTMSAVIYVFLHAYSFAPLVFTQAANHFVNNIDRYPKKLAFTAVTNFIRQNTSFFTELINMRQEFIEFYSSRSTLLVLENYSDSLMKVLKSDGRKIKVEVQEQGSEELISTEMDVAELWYLGYFDDAFENETICIFVLKNTADGAITLWNNRNKP